MTALQQLKQRRDALLAETNDPDFSKDIRENSGRDDVLRSLRLVNEQIEQIEREESDGNSTSFPGTVTYGVKYKFQYLRVVANSLDIKLPPPFVGELVKGVVENKGDIFGNSVEIRPVSDRCAIGKTIKNKLPGKFRVVTRNGYIELEVTTL